MANTIPSRIHPLPTDDVSQKYTPKKKYQSTDHMMLPPTPPPPNNAHRASPSERAYTVVINQILCCDWMSG